MTAPRSAERVTPGAALLPPGFTTRRVAVSGVVLNAVLGGSGPAILLIPGWPQTWFAWRLLMPGLVAAGHSVVVIEPKGIGGSERPPSDDAGAGYDTGTVARELVEAMHLLGHARFACIGHDVGAWIGFALAADHPREVTRAGLIDAIIPGLTPGPLVLGPAASHKRTWHFAFNRAPWAIQAPLLSGSGVSDYVAWQFRTKAARPDAIGREAAAVYQRAYGEPDAMRAALDHYRALDTTMAANVARAKRQVSVPVLTVGGERGVGAALGRMLEPLAPALEQHVIDGCGHYVPEESPERLLDILVGFVGGDQPARTRAA